MDKLHSWSRRFSIYCLNTGFYAIGVVCGPFKSKISIPCSFIVFLHVFFVGFQSQVLYGIAFLLQDLPVGVPDMEQSAHEALWSLPIVDFYLGETFSALPTHLDAVPLLFIGISVHPMLCPFRRKLFYMYLYLCCVCRKRCIRGLPCCYLEPSGKIMLCKFASLFINCT